MVQVNANGLVLTGALLDLVLEQAGPTAAYFQVAPNGEAELLGSELVHEEASGTVMFGRYVFFDANVPVGTLFVLDTAKNVLAVLTNFTAPVSVDLSGVTVTTV